MSGRMTLVGTALLLVWTRAGAQQAADTSTAALQAKFQKYVAADSIVDATLLVMRNGVAVVQVNVGMADRALAQP